MGYVIMKHLHNPPSIVYYEEFIYTTLIIIGLSLVKKGVKIGICQDIIRGTEGRSKCDRNKDSNQNWET